MVEANTLDALEGAGLTPIEAKVYLELLEKGSSTAGPVIKALGLHRATVYSVLQRLMERGLVTYVMKGGTRQFSASDPENVLEIVREHKENIEKILPQLKAKAERSKEKQSAEIYEGSKGFKSVFEGMMRNSEKGRNYVVLGAKADAEPVTDYMNNWIKRWTSRGNNIKMIFTGNSERFDLISKIPNTELKVVPKSYASQASIGVLDDMTNIYLFAKNPFCVSIQNKEIADSFRNYFNLVWNQDVRVYKGFDDAMGRFASMLDTMKKSDEYYVLGASGGESLWNWLNEYHKERVKRGIKLKILYNQNVRDQIKYEMTSTGDPEMKLAQTKELPPEFSSPMQINLYKGNRVLMFLFGKEIICFEMESEILYKNFKGYFDALWNQETATYKGRQGIVSVVDDLLTHKEYLCFGSGGEFESVLGSYFPIFQRKKRELGIENRIILSASQRDKKYICNIFGNIRYMPKETTSPTTTFVYGSKVAILVCSGKNIQAFVINNIETADAFRKYFEVLWRAAKK